MDDDAKAGGRLPRSGCPVANALDTFGDRWTLIVIRDLVMGKRRYGELQKSPENIPSNILADRLRQLERLEVIRRVPYQERPRRYEYLLTEKGADLLPILQAVTRWSGRHIPGGWQVPERFFALTPDDLKRE
ncbi:MAG: helix-turn-helix transcriptional regulator [Proteobacteria bacterium]|nr:helix-turn-helix transcriptional regulator [Pseudomonadota bacterium]